VDGEIGSLIELARDAPAVVLAAFALYEMRQTRHVLVKAVVSIARLETRMEGAMFGRRRVPPVDDGPDDV
jgi:uncharacterized protein YbaA (DUF1428 family)